MILGGNVIRLALMSEQAYSSKPNIDQSCVNSIRNGSYMAQPFNKKCLNYAEIVMLTLVALATLVALIVLISNLVLHQRLNNYRYYFADETWINFDSRTFIESQAQDTQRGSKNQGETNENPEATRDDDETESTPENNNQCD